MGRGRAPCCEKVGLKKGSWTPAEDMRLVAYIQKYGHGNWRALPKQAGLLRCGKSCRLRWINYLRPDIKRGNFTMEEEDTIIRLHEVLGNKWSKIASRLPGRTDNEIKNVWNTHLKKRIASRERNLVSKDPPRSPSSNSTSSLSCSNQGGDGVKDGSAGVLPVDEETSRTCTESLSDDIIEIPIEPNLDMWDMLEEASSHSDMIRSSTEDIPMWDVEWGKQFPLQVQPLLSEGPTKSSLSASSSFSDVTYCNMGERVVETLPRPSAQPGDVDTVSRLPDIPIEPELWNFFEDDSNLFDDIPGVIEQVPAKDVEGNRWIAYLEKELDLPESSGGLPSCETPAKHPVQPPDTGEGKGGAPSVEMDPIASYFQRQHPSPSPFSLSFTDISMT